MKVADKVIIVTGGGSGMGRELVLNLLSKNAKVIAIDVNETSLNETRSLALNYESSLKTFVVDITKKTAVEELLTDSVGTFGHVDGIINNAGIIQPFVSLKDLSYELIDKVFNVNFYGTLYMVKTFLPELLSRPEAHILNVSSMGGFLPVPGQTIYGATKAAVKLMTEGLNSELQGTRVNVTVAFPGAIRTNIMQNSGLGAKTEIPEGKAGMILPAAKAAEIMVNAIERNLLKVMVGKDAKIMNLFYRFSPVRAAKIIADKMKDKIPH